MKDGSVILFQKIVIVVLLVLFLVVFLWEQKIFDDQNDTIDQYMELVEKQRVDNDEIIQMWNDSYNDLERDYADKIVECEKLKDQLKVGVDIPEYSYSYDEVILLAKCVQCEAGKYSEAPDSQKYVTQVILNRVASKDFPNSIEKVIYQKTGGVPQFSVAYNGMIDKCSLENDTLRNVYEVLLYGTDLPDYVLFFYSSSVTENWVNTLNTYVTLQGTVFAYK